MELGRTTRAITAAALATGALAAHEASPEQAYAGGDPTDQVSYQKELARYCGQQVVAHELFTSVYQGVDGVIGGETGGTLAKQDPKCEDIATRTSVRLQFVSRDVGKHAVTPVSNQALIKGSARKRVFERFDIEACKPGEKSRMLQLREKFTYKTKHSFKTRTIYTDPFKIDCKNPVISK
jgi:hypothetical protein